MNKKKTSLLLYVVLGTLVILTSVLVCIETSEKTEADMYLNKLRFEKIAVYLDVHQR